jgi:hypothetical protein
MMQKILIKYRQYHLPTLNDENIIDRVDGLQGLDPRTKKIIYGTYSIIMQMTQNGNIDLRSNSKTIYATLTWFVCHVVRGMKYASQKKIRSLFFVSSVAMNSCLATIGPILQKLTFADYMKMINQE